MLGLNSILESWLQNVAADSVADVVLVAILFILFLSFYQANKGYHSRFLEHAPTLMTSLGILGTFIGIVIGLMNFDTTDTTSIDESIPLMLEGLKTAFITSLAGMASAISFKLADAWSFAPKREAMGSKESISPLHIHEELVKSNDLLNNLKDGMSGSEEGSLVGQLKLARGELNDENRKAAKEREIFSNKLWEEMQHFADLLAKSATEQVIEALRQVIVEFNQNLVEQFGENFKRLDESVRKLVEWQQQYMEQLEQMSIQYGEGVKAIDHTREAVQQIGESTASIPTSLAELRSVIQVNQHQIQELQRHLEVFIEMRDKATSAVPEIKQHLDEVGKQMQEASKQMSEVMLEGATEFKDSVTQTNISMQSLSSTMQKETESISEALRDSVSDLQKGASEMIHRLEDGTKSMQQAFDTQVGAILRGVESQIQSTLNSLNTEVTKSTSLTGESINKQLQAMNDATERELNKVMSEMGQALATISSQFTTDYKQLVNAMNQVVQTGQRQNPIS